MNSSLKNFILSKGTNYRPKFVRIREPEKNTLDLIKKSKTDLELFIKTIKNIDNKKLANFIFFLRVLDFRLWEFNRNWRYKNMNEFYGLLKRLKILFNFENLEKIKFRDFKNIISPLESRSLALIRYNLFKKSLQWLKENYQSNFENYFNQYCYCPKDFCLNLISLDKFKDYYKNFYFLKPNQLLYYEYLLVFKLLNQFEEQLNDLTVFIDYKIPHLFINLNLLVINKKYLKKIIDKKIFKNNSLFVAELRWASLTLAEKIAYKLNIPSYLLDNLLWNLSYIVGTKNTFPRIKSIYY